MKNILFLCTNYHNFDHLYINIAKKCQQRFNTFALFDKYSTFHAYRKVFNVNGVKADFVFERNLANGVQYNPRNNLFYYYQVDYDRLTYFDFKPSMKKDFLETMGTLINSYLKENSIDYVISEGPYNLCAEKT